MVTLAAPAALPALDRNNDSVSSSPRRTPAPKETSAIGHTYRHAAGSPKATAIRAPTAGLHTSSPGQRRQTPAAPAPGGVLVKTAVADDLRNAGGHGVRGDAGTVQAVDSIGLSAVRVRRAAATFGGVRGVAGTVPVAAVTLLVREDAATPGTDPDPLHEAALAADAATVAAPVVATDPGGATDTASTTALEATEGAHHVVHHVHTLLSLETAPLRQAAGGAAVAAVAICFVIGS